MACQRCQSDKLASINAKSSDLNYVTIGERERDGYVPYDFGIGGGDYIRFWWCLNCGQIQGEWPIPLEHIEMFPNEE